MAKAFTMEPHDEKAAYAAYIQLRVQQLKEERSVSAANARQTVQQERVQTTRRAVGLFFGRVGAAIVWLFISAMRLLDDQ